MDFYLLEMGSREKRIVLEELKRVWSKKVGVLLEREGGREYTAPDDNLVIIQGMTPSSAGLFGAGLSTVFKRSPLLFIALNEDTVREIYDSLTYFAGEERAFHFAWWETSLLSDSEEPPLEVRAKHFETLNALLQYSKDNTVRAPLIVASIQTLCRRIFTPDFFAEHIYPVVSGTLLNLEELVNRLICGGYERTEIVESRGEFAIRGGIVDIYPPNLERAIRLDLFGDEVESIRYFDVYSQRSLREKGTLQRVTILPAKEKLLLDAAQRQRKLMSLFHWLPAETQIIIFEGDRFSTRIEEYWHQIEQEFAETSARNSVTQIQSVKELFLSLSEIERELKRFTCWVNHPLEIEQTEKKHLLTFKAQSFEGIPGNIDSYLKYIKERFEEGFEINICCDNEGQAWRLEEILLENGLPAVAEPPHPNKMSDPYYQRLRGEVPGKIITITIGDLHSGFVLPSAGLIFLTDREIFGRYKKRHIFRRFYKSIPVVSADEIKRGDYVVHIDHGIGRFLGIRQQLIDGKKVDLLQIEYQGHDKLLVPVDKIYKIQKYSGVEGLIPPIDKLGSKRWILRKRKSQEAIEKMAKELLEIYARRKMSKGYEYSPDTVWQTEFEATFPYEETPDQLRAIQEVKADLESPKPMDRLVCGDVAYGKTEVAIRAAFKVVQEKKQVALLCPTTILAQQHYRTFQERFAGFPVRIEMLSRFRTSKEQRDILHRLKYGDIDIIIGTHRLLSDDVEFCDLGLVIVDEEQRFGVRHKEKLKKMRASVDFLTLTATPIPRTLYMALSGLRDMSIINTPPPGRLPIKTKIIHFEPELIREAILREINRGGQVFFVHNRIHNIHRVAEEIQKYVPNVRIAIAHGRMRERELEKVMIDFVERKYDVLISTTIIENGLDIPNVNTIIINRADAFGLAQLYQLRGRIGRDIRQAYAYLIVPKGEPITETALKRLSAIEEFTELGSGFNVAMRDLEIRGAGNLLGREQHGCIVSIGFDLYCQLLEQTIRRLKGEEIEEEERPVEIRLQLDAYLPREYIPIESLRIGVYKRLAQARNVEAVDELREEMRDRYGRIPEVVENLLKITKLRVIAQHLGIKRILQNHRQFIIYTPENSEDFSALMENCKGKEYFRIKEESPGQISLKAREKKLISVELAERFFELMNELYGLKKTGAYSGRDKQKTPCQSYS